MGNLAGNVNLIVVTIPVEGIDKRSLVSILEVDSDFTDNEDYFREDTISLGYENEAERVSEEIYEAHKNDYKHPTIKDLQVLEAMIVDLFNTPNFIGVSGHYGAYEYEITETQLEYIISIAYIN